MKNNYDINKLFDFFDYWKDYTHPTEFYNEGWLLKLLVLAVTDCNLREHPLFVNHENKFFSEGLLPSPFLTKGEKNPFAESHTHADGAIGDFTVGNDNTKGLLELKGNTLNIFEAKINSDFSKGVTNASFYNQAARYVACMVETLDKAEKLENLENLSIGFYLTVPKNQYGKKKNFGEYMDREDIKNIVKKRVDQYENEDDYIQRIEWFDRKFIPVLNKITIEPIFYEDIIKDLQGYDHIIKISKFYELCIVKNV